MKRQEKRILIKLVKEEIAKEHSMKTAVRKYCWRGQLHKTNNKELL